MSLLPSPGLPILFAQLDVNAAMLNRLTGPLVHTSIMQYIKLFAIDTTNLSLPQKSLLLFLVADCAGNPRRKWDIIIRILHRNSSTVLPSSVSLFSLASQLATFFKEKISQLRLTLSANHFQSAHYPSQMPSHPNFSVFLPATEDEIIKLISDFPNKQCGLKQMR